ncbi:hypothetical protein ACFFX0_22660 [Citricoccus parietis]|uniref:Uncharacterized protein n=1 Tax=Citricoccus parietis TaxID=592307 RepID=A0ABV5G4I2_9MICC
MKTRSTRPRCRGNRCGCHGIVVGAERMVRDSNSWYGVTAHWFSSFGDPGMAGSGQSRWVPTSPESRAFPSVSCQLVLRRYCACGHRMATVRTEIF